MFKLKKFLFLLFIILGALVFAAETELTQAVNAGSLTITAPTDAGFTAVDYSFSGQSSSANPLGTINVSDLRGSGIGWSVDVTGEDWSDGTHPMDYDGNGTTTGQLSLDIGTTSDVTVNDGDSSLTDWTMGTDDAFDSAPTPTDTINLVTVASPGGEGDYDIDATEAAQFLPGRQKAGSYTMTLTYTVS